MNKRLGARDVAVGRAARLRRRRTLARGQCDHARRRGVDAEVEGQLTVPLGFELADDRAERPA